MLRCGRLLHPEARETEDGKEAGERMSDELQVTLTHLTELMARQHRAGDEITGAVVTTAGVEATVAVTHGAIAAATQGGLHSVQASRAAAGAALVESSSDLSSTLDFAAHSYQRVDLEHADRNATQMQPSR